MKLRFVAVALSEVIKMTRSVPITRAVSSPVRSTARVAFRALDTPSGVTALAVSTIAAASVVVANSTVPGVDIVEPATVDVTAPVTARVPPEGVIEVISAFAPDAAMPVVCEVVILPHVGAVAIPPEISAFPVATAAIRVRLLVPLAVRRSPTA